MLSIYCGNLQVVADVHSVHVFLRDGVRALQISQKASRLEGVREKPKMTRDNYRQQHRLDIHLCRRLTNILLSRFIATGFSAVHSPTRCRLSCLNGQREMFQSFNSYFCEGWTKTGEHCSVFGPVRQHPLVTADSEQ